jgi:epoxide hydrolase
MDEVHPFRLAVPDAVLADLRARLQATRWPERETVPDWSQGVPLTYVQEFCAYWTDKHDWRAREAALNAFPSSRPRSTSWTCTSTTCAPRIRARCR